MNVNMNMHVNPPPLREEYNDAYTTAPTTTDDYNNNSTNANSNGFGGSSSSAGVWNYMLGVSLFLVCWVVSLVMPKGVRKQVFGSQPRRYSRRRYAPTEIGDMSMTVLSAMGSVDESILLEVEKRRMENDMSIAPSTIMAQSTIHSQQQQSYLTTPQQHQHHTMMRPPRSTISESDAGASVYLRPMMRSNATRGSRASTASGPFGSNSGVRASPTFGMPPPSPGHPAIQRLPSAKILNETMQRLKTRGIRLVAHGVASDSKRVWIKLEDDETTSLSWQTEFPRKIPNQSGEVSLVMMRGALHRIALPNVLYVDVGKKTNALLKTENRDVLDTTCFSLLTQNGSLDLQANSRLERDALVSCFSMVLDEVHTQDWRSLYAESPDTSAVQSSCTGSDLHLVDF